MNNNAIKKLKKLTNKELVYLVASVKNLIDIVSAEFEFTRGKKANIQNVLVSVECNGSIDVWIIVEDDSFERRFLLSGNVFYSIAAKLDRVEYYDYDNFISEAKSRIGKKEITDNDIMFLLGM